jgi:hypothetical protein
MAEKRPLKPRSAATADKAPAAAAEPVPAADEQITQPVPEPEAPTASQEAPQAVQAEAAGQVQETPAEQPPAPPQAMAGPGMLYPSGTAPAQPETNLAAIVDRDEQVIVTVPHNYTLRIDNSSTRDFKTGVQKMPRWMAEHWYSKAHGVAVFKG